MATQAANRQWVTPTRFMVGLGVVVVACLVAALVLSMPLAGLFFGTGIAALVMLAMTAGYFLADRRRQRRAGATR